MPMRNCYSRLFLFIIVLSLLPLHGVEIKFYDCAGKELIPDKIEYAKKWDEAAQNVINNQGVIDCLPGNWKSPAETWMKYSKVKIKICRQKLYNPNNCGNLDLDNNIVVPEENNSGCGCAEASVFHEFIHQAVPVDEDETNDRKIRGCEKLILSRFIKNCQDNPPPGATCDCMDQEKNQSPCLWCKGTTPIQNFKPKFQAENVSEVTRGRGEIRTMTPQKVKRIVLKHFRHQSLTIPGEF